VVALAGATGGGKSSLFNALARLELSPVGLFRPTTNATHACVWGRPAGDLLDWLGVAPDRRSSRESALDADDEAALRGLVLLDLPDMDTRAGAHRVETDRLLGVVDLVVWVLDPQKYADQVVHEGYLRELGPVRDMTMAVFNQVDRLTPADAAHCRADLTRLLEEDGLPGIPLVLTSAQTGAGLDELRVWLEKAVGAQAAPARIEGELAATVRRLRPLVGTRAAPPVDEVALTDEVAGAVGVDAVTARAAQVHAANSRIPVRGRPGQDPAIPPADPAAVRLAVRRYASGAAAGLPTPWPEQIWNAARGGLGALPQELADAVMAARPPAPRAWGWRLARAGFWLGVLAAVGGGVWLGLDRSPWAWSAIAGGLVLAGAMLALRPVARARTRRHEARTRDRLRAALAAVAERVAEPVRLVRRDHETARLSLAEAADD
jgi:hypothetical protein